MNCARARFLVYAYLDRELPRPDAEALDRHIASCPACALRARSARRLRRMLQTQLVQATAPQKLRERLHSGVVSPPLRHRYAPFGIAASILVLILPLVADQPGPKTAMSLAGTPAVVSGAGRIVPVSKRMTGTFVCLEGEERHEKGHCPLPDMAHDVGFCADDGETWRLMTADSAFATASVGQTVTVEGLAFPESGFLHASRVGY